jgi:predicted  nucleic acid-binding Zn-ribbon protein
MNKTKFFSSMLVVALFATASVLTSCKDYDDDIKNLQQQIDAKSAKAELESLQSTLQTQLSSVQSSLDTKIANLNTAIANKADASTVTALASSVQDLTATVAALQTQLSSVNSALADYAKTSDVDALNTKYVALTGDVSTLKGDVEGLKSETALLKAADENLKQQITALQNLSTALDQLKTKVANLEANGYDDTELKNAIAALQTKLADYDALKSDVATLKNVMQMMSEEVNKVKSQVNVLNVFVNKRLTSMILMPNFYWEGLEAIEVPFAYTPEFKEQAKDYTFTYTQTSALGNEDIAVTVKSYMTAALTDGQTVNLETATADKGPWTDLAGPANLTEATIRTLVVRQGLINKKTGLAYTAATAANAPLSFVELSQGGVAKYHISPTTANLEGMKVGFFENDAEVYTRAAGAIAATPFETTISKDNKYNKFENGVLTVPFKVDGPKLKAMFNAWTATNLAANDPNWDATDGNGTLGTPADKKSAPLPFLAGQLTSADNDTTVTSDYAVLVPADITIIALAD